MECKILEEKNKNENGMTAEGVKETEKQVADKEEIEKGTTENLLEDENRTEEKNKEEKEAVGKEKATEIIEEKKEEKGIKIEESFNEIQTKSVKNLPKGITKRADGRYQATYYYMGVRHYLYDMDLEKITKRLRDIQYEMEHGIYCKPEKIRLNDWFEVWIKEYKELMVKKGTLENYRRNYNCYIRPYI